MTISELIKLLTELQEKHGDLPVFHEREGYGPNELDSAEYAGPTSSAWRNKYEDAVPANGAILLE